MVYTQARLEHALYVFRNASPYIRARGLRAKNLRSHLGRNDKFSSRPIDHTSKEFRIWQSACRHDCDTDSDDEYHPDKSEKRKKKLNGLEKKPKKLKRKSDNYEDGDPETKSKKRRKEKVEAISEAPTCYTTLKLSSERGRFFLQVLADVVIRENSPDGPSLFRLTGGSFDEAKPPQIPEWMQLEQELALEGLDLEEGTLRSGKRRDKSSVHKCKQHQELPEPIVEGNASWASHPTSSSAISRSNDNTAAGNSNKTSTVESNVIIIDDTDDESGAKSLHSRRRCALEHSMRHASVQNDRRRFPQRPKIPRAACEVIVIDDTDDEEGSVIANNTNSTSTRTSEQRRVQTTKSNVIVIDDSD